MSMRILADFGQSVELHQQQHSAVEARPARPEGIAGSLPGRNQERPRPGACAGAGAAHGFAGYGERGAGDHAVH